MTRVVNNSAFCSLAIRRAFFLDQPIENKALLVALVDSTWTNSTSAFSKQTQSSSRKLLRYSFCKAMAEFPSTYTSGGRRITDTDAPTDTADDLLNFSLVKLFSKNRSSQTNSDHVFPRKYVSPALHFSHRPLGMIPYSH